MPRKIENIWDPVPPGDTTFGTCNVYTTASGEEDTLIGTISLRKSETEFYTGPYGSDRAQPDTILESDRIISGEMAEEYYTGVIASGSETIVDNNITYRLIED